MGIVTAIILGAMANAQSPDWNRQLPDSRTSGLPPFMEGAPQGFGLGFYFGKPLSAAASYYKGVFTTQLLLGMWFPNTYRISVDQLYSVYVLQFGEYLSLPMNVGLGTCLYFNEQTSGDYFGGGGTTFNHVGLRAPLNVAINHSQMAIDVYTEFVPTLKIKPRVSFEGYGGLGLRFYPFNKEQ